MNDLVDLAVRSLRDKTSAEADGAMTRQRIEAGWLQHRARGKAIRGMMIAAAVAFGVGGAALAATSLVIHARLASPTVPPAGGPRPLERPDRAIVPRSAPLAGTAWPEPVSAPTPVRAADPPVRSTGAATAVYAAAHRVHFLDRDWARALGLWTRYLRLAPRGPLAPEAHFNRAICLVRLDRSDEATAELQPFANGQWGTYRQREARQLLDALTRTIR